MDSRTESPNLSDAEQDHPNLTNLTLEEAKTALKDPQEAPETKEEPQLLALQPNKMSTQQYTINGVTITVTDVATSNESETLYTKAERAKYKDKDRIELLERIQKAQQEPFKSITISVNDPEKMTHTHSLAQILAENRRNLVKYDLHDVFSIVFPRPGAFTKGNAEHRLLRSETGQANVPITKDLFTDYLGLTAEQVANSSKWYTLFVPQDQLMQENLRWSLAYYEKNVEKTLYSKVHSQLLEYPVESRGGPLFLKLLLDRVSTTNEANLKAIIHITETYKIKRSCKGEDIETVVELFRALYDNMSSLKHGTLPEDSVKNLLHVFQTTSVSSFNDLFATMEKERLNNEVRASIDHLFAKQPTGAIVLGNDMKSVDFILKYAERVYRTFVQKGTWDEVMQRPPGKSAFVELPQSKLGPSGFQHPTETKGTIDPNLPPIVEWTNPGDCYNCGNKGCRTITCKHPKDKLRIRRNKEKELRIKMNELPKFRLPEPHENNKRIINGKPYTFYPNKSATGRWEADETPSDGQHNDGNVPDVLSDTSRSGNTSSLSSDTRSSAFVTSAVDALGLSNDPVERKMQLMLHMKELQKEFSKYS